MTIAQMVSEVEWNVNRAGLTAVGTHIRTAVTDELKAWVARALWPPPRPGQRSVGEPHNWSFMMKDQQAAYTYGNNGWVDLPEKTTRFLRIISLSLVLSTGRYRPLDLGNWHELTARYAGRSQGDPEEYALDMNSRRVRLFPDPDAAKTLHFFYATKINPTDLATDAFTPYEFGTEHSDAIVDGATARVLRPLDAKAKADDFRGKANMALAAAIAADRRTMLQPEVKIWMTPNAAGTPENPRPLMSDVPTRRITPDY